ncbi:Mu-like prophage protein gp16 [Moraxella cuniculi DSM 21768]|uniref:Mu-like prophage protein gp16 n=1 Tax=Moraxella cuniculi DSM 21768 TaxID=1122245 RepID=A0A1N7DHT7_9GAMM|nr:regulatory protein GemA [Moraxella cuniculi]OOS08073.1 hypothetical protein B0189_01700 [Moraxella cuniculi]SIR75423.1 Mu-like prophage protein gp16 [Moraxella cuniculi DSM 21768]
MKNKSYPKSQYNKPKLIQLIHIGKSKLCLDDDTYRSLLISMTGKTSTKAMNIGELNKVLARLKALGFTVRSKLAYQKPMKEKYDIEIGEQIKLMRHLWLELYELGAVKNPSEQALTSYIQNQTKTTIDNLSSKQASNIIERLKNWLKRLEKQNQNPH